MELLSELIGNTKMIKVKLVENENIKFFTKLEMYNATGSTKDRIAKYIIERAEAEGKLLKSSIIIEATSGNTGSSVAMIGALKGYKVILVTSDKTSLEKVNSMKMFGAQVYICPSKVPPDSPDHYMNYSKILAKETPNSFLIDQYNNLLNPEAHYNSTGPEIWEQCNGKIDYLVATGSTGGTISGVAKYLRERNKDIKIILADPLGSAYYYYFKNNIIKSSDIKSYMVEGAGKDSLCPCMDLSLVDDVIQFNDEEAFKMVEKFSQKTGLLVGGSSGGALHVAVNIAKKIDKGNIVAILPDNGLKYLSKFNDIMSCIDKNYQNKKPDISDKIYNKPFPIDNKITSELNNNNKIL